MNTFDLRTAKIRNLTSITLSDTLAETLGTILVLE